jgi:4-amino-4-deoxy-L-arabinose transferase-like glycosyltransferase
MASFFQSLEHRLLAVLAVLLSLNSLFFISREVDLLHFLSFTHDTGIFYLLYAILFVLTVGIIAFFSPFHWQRWLSKLLLVFFPTEVLIIWGLNESKQFHYLFLLATGLYVILAGLALISLHHNKQPAIASSFSFKTWLRQQGWAALALVLLVMATNLGFGTYKIAQFAAVDEPLWTFGRIQRYWKNIAEREWNKTDVSDKPGITVALISGIGLLSENPKQYKALMYDGGASSSKNIEDLNFALRFPILVATMLMLPLFYFFLERLVGKEGALFSTVLIGTSPILLGMARIINPDSLLWTFAPLSLLSYLVFLKRKNLWYLYGAGILLGLALLTKYVANIVFVFFFGLIFLEYIFMRTKERVSLDPVRYFKQSFLHYLIVTFCALAVFYLLLPDTWVKPDHLLNATLLSQAFESTWPLFIGILAFLFLDQRLLRNRVSAALLDFLAVHKRWLVLAISGFFAASVILVVSNTYQHMRWYDFESVLASPKSAYAAEGFGSVFFANFYPMLFGIAPVAFFLVLLGLFFTFQKASRLSTPLKTSFYFIILTLLYYLASTINHVAAISRYQIIIYPAILIVAGIAAGTLFRLLQRKYPRLSLPATALSLFIVSASSLALSSPLYLSYASGLLPKQYSIDIKDMGTGSYEAAAFLNSLPDAANLTIWTDKKGVCTFFKGDCYSSFNFAKLHDKGLDYIVVSSGRKSRTTRMMQSHIAKAHPELIRFDQYYDQEEGFAYKLEINGRPNNYVKVFPFHGTNATTLP